MACRWVRRSEEAGGSPEALLPPGRARGSPGAEVWVSATTEQLQGCSWSLTLLDVCAAPHWPLCALTLHAPPGASKKPLVVFKVLCSRGIFTLLGLCSFQKLKLRPVKISECS